MADAISFRCQLLNSCCPSYWMNHARFAGAFSDAIDSFGIFISDLCRKSCVISFQNEFARSLSDKVLQTAFS